MGDTTSIIIYRNPLEQMFWEGLLSSPLTFPLIVAIASAIVTVLIVAGMFDKFQRRLIANKKFNGRDSRLLNWSYAIRRQEGVIAIVIFSLTIGIVLHLMM